MLCIPPFNYPVNLAVSKLAPAMIAGNACVMKPPTQGAVAGVLMAQCFIKASGWTRPLFRIRRLRCPYLVYTDRKFGMWRKQGC